MLKKPTFSYISSLFSQAMPVREVNGVITDPKSGASIDLHKFSNVNGFVNISKCLL